MKRNEGSITIEASIGFTVFLLVFFAIQSIGQYASIQEKVKHCVNQTALTVSYDNRVRKLFGKDALIGSIKNILKAIDNAYDTNYSDHYADAKTYSELWKVQEQNETYFRTEVVPDVKGKNYEDAYKILRNLKFVVSFKTDANSIKYNGAKEGEVLDQYPKPGIEWKHGNTVRITVATQKKDFQYHPDDDDDVGRQYVKNSIKSMFTYYMTGEMIEPNDSGFEEKILNKLKENRISYISFDNTQITSSGITVRVEYKIKTGITFLSLFGVDDVLFTDYYSMPLQ